MKNLTKTAKILDTVFRVAQTAFIVLTIAAGVCVALIGLGWLLGWDPDTIATGYEGLDFGFLELQIADAFTPDKWLVLLQAAVMLTLCGACCLVGWFGIRCIRNILSPMIQGQPFHSATARELKKLSILSFVLGALLNATLLAEQIFTFFTYNLSELFISEKIVNVDVNFEFDLTFLLYSGVLLLLSYVFRYGTQLQELSDETL